MILSGFCGLDNTKYQVSYFSALELKYSTLKLILELNFKQCNHEKQKFTLHPIPK